MDSARLEALVNWIAQNPILAGAVIFLIAFGDALVIVGVAIPAVLAYNFFVRLNRVSNSQFDTFAHDLHDFFATGSRVGEIAGKR